MAEWLAERFPHEQEGDLGPRLAVLVSQPVLAEVAEAIGLGEALSVSPGEARAGVRRRATVLADALEAALGALYLDGGLEPARAFRAARLGGRDEPAETSRRRMPRRRLQEWVQARGLGLPDYMVASRAGPPHAPEFVVTVAPAASPAPAPPAASARPSNLRRRTAAGARRVTSGSSPVAGSRCGFVAIVGAPNAGKSTLLNRLTGAKLSIVTPKAQTTRFRVLGILMRGESQVLLVDTPGIFTPRRRLDRAMVAAAWTGVRDADLALLLVDAKAGATRGGARDRRDAGGAAAAVLAGAEQDRSGAGAALLPLTAALTALAPFEQTFMVSAATGDGVEQLADALAGAVPEGPHLYPDDDLTDLPDRLLAAEIVREQIFLQTHEEVPYGTTVETENWQERKDGSVRIEATVYVARPGHKAILIGEGGKRIKAIGARRARGTGGAAGAQGASVPEREAARRMG